MTMQNHTLHCTGSAIAAALVLASTPALAQDLGTAPATDPAPVETMPAAPVFVPPVQPVQAQPAPVTAPASTTPDPVVQTIPPTPVEPIEVAEPAPAATTASVTETQTQAQPQSAAPQGDIRAAASSIASSTADAEVVPLAEPMPVEPAGENFEPAAAPATDFSEQTDAYAQDVDLSMLAGLIGAVGIALLGLILLYARRRKPTPTKAKRAGLPEARDSQPQPKDKTVAPAAVVEAETPERDADDPLPFWRVERAAVPTSGRATGAATPLPSKKPETVDERKALIDQIARARPDRANPFTSMKARRRRARLIVQSLDDTFEHGSKIDFSQYPQIWPHLARDSEHRIAA